MQRPPSERPQGQILLQRLLSARTVQEREEVEKTISSVLGFNLGDFRAAAVAAGPDQTRAATMAVYAELVRRLAARDAESTGWRGPIPERPREEDLLSVVDRAAGLREEASTSRHESSRDLLRLYADEVEGGAALLYMKLRHRQDYVLLFQRQSVIERQEETAGIRRLADEARQLRGDPHQETRRWAGRTATAHLLNELARTVGQRALHRQIAAEAASRREEPARSVLIHARSALAGRGDATAAYAPVALSAVEAQVPQVRRMRTQEAEAPAAAAALTA